MISIPVTLTSTNDSIANLIYDDLPEYIQRMVGDRDDFRMDTVIQAPDGNTGNINIGSSTDQSGFIEPGGTMGVAKMNLNKTYISDNTSGDSIVILLMD